MKPQISDRRIEYLLDELLFVLTGLHTLPDPQGKELFYQIFTYMSDEEQDSIIDLLHRLVARTAEYLGFPTAADYYSEHETIQFLFAIEQVLLIQGYVESFLRFGESHGLLSYSVVLRRLEHLLRDVKITEF